LKRPRLKRQQSALQSNTSDTMSNTQHDKLDNTVIWRLAYAYNDVAYAMLHYDDKAMIIERMDDLRRMIGGLLAVYIPDDPDGDCNCLADEVKLVDILVDILEEETR
jgi:hypothetical protein